MKSFLSTIRRRVVVFDSPVHTQYKRYGLETLPDSLNLTHPSFVKKIHTEYIKAGCDVITTNTFNSNRIKLSEFKLQGRFEKINREGVRLAKEAAKTKFVAASVGPTGKVITDSAKNVYKAFAEQVKIFQSEDVDAIIIEAMEDIVELKTAILASKENSTLPIVATFYFEKAATTPEVVAVVTESMGVDGVGVDFEGDINTAKRILSKLIQFTTLPILIRFDWERLSVSDLIDTGANMIGGWYGTTPEQIRSIKPNIPTGRIKKRTLPSCTYVSSRKKVVKIGDFPVVIGESINPSGKKRLQKAIKDGDFSSIVQLGVQEAEAGADILDVNLSVPSTDETAIMPKVVSLLSNSVDLPLSIDTTSIRVLEQTLPLYPGKLLVNSTTGEEKKLKRILPLIKRYGSALIGLTIDEEGIPKNAKKRVQIAKKIIEWCAEYGISKSDIIIDPLTLSISTDTEAVMQTLDALKEIKDKLSVATVLGISNVSYGLPNRKILNSILLSMAISRGLDVAFMDPFDKAMWNTLYSSALLANKDPHVKRFLTYFQPLSVKETHHSLYDVIIEGDKGKVPSLVEASLKEMEPFSVVDKVITPALKEVGERFNRGEVFIPQLMLSAESAKIATNIIREEMGMHRDSLSNKGKIVFATVRGDLHDIGKNIVIAVLENHGYEVIDLGKDIPSKKIIEEAISRRADIIGLSALMTTTMLEMKNLIEELHRRKINLKVLIGGACVTRKYADSIGANGYANDAVEAVKIVEKLLGRNV